MDERKHLTFVLLSLAAFAQQPALSPRHCLSTSSCCSATVILTWTTSPASHSRDHIIQPFPLPVPFSFGNLGEDPDPARWDIIPLCDLNIVQLRTNDVTFAQKKNAMGMIFESLGDRD